MHLTTNTAMMPEEYIVPLPEDDQGYLPLDGESKEAFNAYCLYRDTLTDKGRRSLDVAYRKHMGRDEPTLVASGRWRDWSTRYHWRERVVSYDNYQARVEQTAREKAKVKVQEKWELRREEQREKEFSVARSLMEKAEAMLTHPLTRKRYEEDGKTIIVEPMKWNMSDAARLADIASKLARLASEMSTDHTVTEVVGATDLTRIAQMDENELDRQLERLASLETGQTPPGLPN